jgi:hypothetical protein
MLLSTNIEATDAPEMAAHDGFQGQSTRPSQTLAFGTVVPSLQVFFTAELLLSVARHK